MDAKVLEKDRAILWLKRKAKELIRQFPDSPYNSEDTADIVKDLLEWVEYIIDHNYEYVVIEENPMSVSTIYVRGVERKNNE